MSRSGGGKRERQTGDEESSWNTRVVSESGVFNLNLS